MPSRAEMRVRVEYVSRAIVIVSLAVMLWQSLREQTDSSSQTVNARSVGRSALTEWSALSKAPGKIHVQLDRVPSKIERSWLGALAGAGSSVTWAGDLSPTMIDAQPIASPTGGTNVFVAAPSGSSVVMSDDVGVIDSLRPEHAGAAVTLSSAVGELTARVKGSAASTIQRDSLALRKVLVIGEAGWESKFVVAALEENGWRVDALIRVAPGVDVTQGSPAVVDTSRYSAVVALDGAAAPYASRIVDFARTGGGVVLGPQAASLDAMAALRSGAPGRATSDVHPTQASGSVSLATLGFAPITSLKSDAVPFEKRVGVTTIAARRIGAGRVLQVAYEDTWRWRMSGTDAAVRDYRIWWTRIVGSVAYALHVARAETTPQTDETPMIGLVAVLGPRAESGDLANFTTGRSDWMTWLFVLLPFILIGEVASRRLRGAS